MPPVNRRRAMVSLAGAMPAVTAIAAPIRLLDVAAPAVIGARYRASFVDEFDDRDVGRFNENAVARSSGLPAWRSRLRHPRKDIINREKQIYVDPEYRGRGQQALGIQPFSLGDGCLRIEARPIVNAAHRAQLYGMAYTSGCISSQFTHAQRYGYFEMRARLPRGRGFWPAFWLLPVRDTWPPEIDIMEASGARPGAIHFSVRHAGDKRGRSSGWQAISVPTDGWQTFACEWTPSHIRFLVDSRLQWEVKDHGVHEPMYMIANLALGSHDANWIPDPDASTPFPGRFEIDYIRAFSRP